MVILVVDLSSAEITSVLDSVPLFDSYPGKRLYLGPYCVDKSISYILEYLN